MTFHTGAETAIDVLHATGGLQPFDRGIDRVTRREGTLHDDGVRRDAEVAGELLEASGNRRLAVAAGPHEAGDPTGLAGRAAKNDQVGWDLDSDGFEERDASVDIDANRTGAGNLQIVLGKKLVCGTASGIQRPTYFLASAPTVPCLEAGFARSFAFCRSAAPGRK